MLSNKVSKPKKSSTMHLKIHYSSRCSKVPNGAGHGLAVLASGSDSYMISPDAANMGVKAVYVCAGLLIPTTVLLYLYHPEVCSQCVLAYSILPPYETYGRTYWELDELYVRKIPA